MAENKRGLVTFVVERVYFHSDRIARRLKVLADEIRIRFSGVFQVHWVLARTYSWIAVGAIDSTSVGVGPGQWFKRILGAALLLVLFPLALVATLLAGSIAGTLGLRNTGDYSIRDQFGAWILPLLCLFSLPLFLSEFGLYRVGSICTYAILLIGLDFLFGQCGITSLGHAGFAALGAYLTVWFYNGAFGFALPFAVSLSVAAVICAASGSVLAFLSLRIKDYHLAIATLAFSLTVPLTLKSKYFADIAGLKEGGLSIKQMPFTGVFPNVPPFLVHYYLSILFFGVLMYFAFNLIKRSQIGRGFLTIKCDIEIAGPLGVPVFKYKILAFALSALYASIAGGLFVLKTGFISVDTFTLHESLLYIIALMLGGSGSILGCILGAVFLTFEPDIGSKVGALLPRGSQLTYAITGALMIFTLYFAPHGVAGSLNAMARRRFSTRIRRGHNFTNPPADYNLIGSLGLPSTSVHLNRNKDE